VIRNKTFRALKIHLHKIIFFKPLLDDLVGFGWLGVLGGVIAGWITG
jgi:hypothetical protein